MSVGDIEHAAADANEARTLRRALRFGTWGASATRHSPVEDALGILAVYLQNRFGWRAGLTQLCVDRLVLVTAFAVITPLAVLYSVLGALVLNLFLAINHRTDRYLAV